MKPVVRTRAGVSAIAVRTARISARMRAAIEDLALMLTV